MGRGIEVHGENRDSEDLYMSEERRINVLTTAKCNK
jgi:hypothetical protein